MPANPKTPRETDKEYLKYIKKQPCIVCFGRENICPHHSKTRGAGGADLLCVPLCPYHHQNVHQMGSERFQRAYNVDFQIEIVQLLIGYIKEIKRTYPDKWFKKGQMSVKRKNESGCCCEISDNDEVVSPCMAHLNWKKEKWK